MNTETTARIGMLLLLFGMAPSLLAHELYMARFELGRGQEVNTYHLQVLLPSRSSVRDEENKLLWPDECVVTDSSELFHGGQLRYEFSFQCEQGLSPGAELQTPWGLDGSVFTSHLQAGNSYNQILAGRTGGVTLPIGQAEPPERSILETGREYAGLGMFHILEGWDHLAFVLCLCLLVRGRALLILVTAFTLGHSVSLALSYLGYLSIPMRPVEAVIALSVAFMAREALVSKPMTANDPIGWRYPAVVAAFGLLHGLGFASELERLGVSTGERITGLLAFNLGVEAGQLVFVAIALLVFGAARLLELGSAPRISALGATGILGMYWFAERLSDTIML